ncbi:MAG: 16S rRNA (cytosine(1402)-N(4))-methyltransferase RsmH [Bacilli bacterium]|nr:16S rRNA (cytosine(1402)-N(4))-methyltransferase RsmH [Bacilli bacterium]
MGKHVSVLLNEAIESLNIKPDGTYLDLTLGRGGHSSEILKRLSTGKLIAFDKDEEAVKESYERLSAISDRFEIIREDFRNFKSVLLKKNISHVDGILVDLGVSSPQFDEDVRGFSYRSDARLDMRMDTRQALTAYDVVNTYSLKDLTEVFREYGEDKYSYQIAKRIVEIRDQNPIETTTQLVDVIKAVKPQKELMKKGHPAKQIFQALRIEVNDELGALKEMLSDALDALNASGRMVVISFHSLEDRLVKNAFASVSKVEGSRHNVFALPNADDEPKYRLIGKVVAPSEQEMNDNPRSKSAKMRVIERVRL